ncbi:MAG: Outer membrane TonB-dependent transporter, utilization system for glycans and polysaccharides (PUL), SusC family [uncultured Cytophagales bacterium]|uniref:Outer membrane TonB-dependent transporter, utilization system for glycans and polysaccharides (PUL), SusC family n=1 Tax=uncultured Cytophagales bacterium TaxID=158755 RepID=A0A6J4IJA2_9SPHI|nr:MAG: Outer membrane TonB-dependent transporter, utilization system for glycans and polysaccharides (PUL), SusC family [uncultured Cytophagales bacterium]
MRKDYLLVAGLLVLPTLFSPGRSLYAQTLASGPADPAGTARIETPAAVADIPVSGRVTDENGGGIPGVSVLVKGTTNGTTTDVDGRYKLTAPDNATLVFSFIGYITQEAAIGNRGTVNVSLATDVKALSEVVVVGYGTQKKETLTGSITSVKGSEIVQAPVTNVTNSLVGRLPGLVAITPSGEPGNDGSTLRIRGVNSLGNNDPLIVVDGIPGRSLERIDQNSVESITVLKDASAAIYGAQAANGVILVTTKRGKVGKPEVTLNLNQGYGRPTRIPDMADAAEYATMLNEIERYKSTDPANYSPKYSDEEIGKFRDGSDPWRYPNTDWFKEVLRPWSGQAYGNVQVTGGSESLRYFGSFGTKGQQGFYQNSATKYNQYDLRGNLDGKIGEHISFAIDVAGRQENRNYPTRSAGSIFRMVMRGKPQMHAYWPNGTPGPDIEYGDNPAVVSTDATGYDRNRLYVLQNTLRLNVDIPWVKGLSINTNAGIDKAFAFGKRFETPWFLYSWDGQTYGADGEPLLVKGKKGFDDPRLRQNTADVQDILVNGMINYERTFGSIHNFKFMAGTERRTARGDRFDAYRRFFVSTAIDQLFAGGDADKDNGGSAYQQARLNYFGRVNYNLSEKYLFEVVWRYDGSYIFPETKRYGFFPGFSAGWRVSEESFWKDNVTFSDNFKLRASWGQTGNDRIDEFQYLATYGFGRWEEPPLRFQPYIFGITQEHKTLYETRIPNENVTWEIANQFNVGLETDLFNNKLLVSLDYFYNTRSQILWWRNASIPGSTGLSLPRENIGKVANRGFEFSVGYKNTAGGLEYEVSANGGYQKNKITFWDESPGRPEYQRTTDRPIPTNPFSPDDDLYYQALGIFRDQAQVDATPAKWANARPGDVIFEDVNGDGEINANDRVRNEKTNVPRFMGGVKTRLAYKGFDLEILFQGAAGAVQYVQTESGEIGNFLKSFYDERWTPENPDAGGPRTFNRDNEYWRNNRNTHFLRKTDYLRLKNLQFGYSLPGSLTERLRIKNLRLYVSGLNLLTYSPDFKDFDPETSSNNGQGYPLQKVINGGLTFTF